jgi:hypothetical protein
MTRFSTLQLVDGKLVQTGVREIAQKAIRKCPHVILMPDHYRPDGSCRCTDHTHLEMKDWGYRWRAGAWR